MEYRLDHWPTPGAELADPFLSNGPPPPIPSQTGDEKLRIKRGTVFNWPETLLSVVSVLNGFVCVVGPGLICVMSGRNGMQSCLEFASCSPKSEVRNSRGCAKDKRTWQSAPSSREVCHKLFCGCFNEYAGRHEVGETYIQFVGLFPGLKPQLISWRSLGRLLTAWHVDVPSWHLSDAYLSKPFRKLV